MNSIKKALEYIKGYCNKHIDCDTCKLGSKECICVLRNQDEPPADWNVDKMLGKESERK